MKIRHYAILGGIILLADQILKHRVESDFPSRYPRTVRLFGDFLLLYRNHNDGFPFGVLRRHQELVKAVPLLMTGAAGGVLVRVLSEARSRVADRIAWTLITAGGLSNLLDRFHWGYVVDYLCINRKAAKKVVFNLGDVAVALGGVIMTVIAFIDDKSTGKAGSCADPEALR